MLTCALGIPADTLVDEARRGRLDAFNQLVVSFQARAYNLAYHLLGDAEAAADATQDSFIKAYRSIEQFKGGSFQAWLLRIVANTCYDELRRRQRRNAHVVEAADDDDAGEGIQYRDTRESPEQAVLRRELADEIRAAILTLPPDQRTALVLSDIEGLGYQEIAGIAGIPVGTVKSRLARARAGVRARLQAQDRIARPITAIN